MARKLKTETNTPAMLERIMIAFAASDYVSQTGGFFDVDFEHGQWWITGENGAQWSVMDAEGGPAIDGFDFERVSEGDSP